MLDYIDRNNDEGIFFTADIEKAFDHCILFSVLKVFRFREHFIRMAQNFVILNSSKELDCAIHYLLIYLSKFP